MNEKRRYNMSAAQSNASEYGGHWYLEEVQDLHYLIQHKKDLSHMDAQDMDLTGITTIEGIDFSESTFYMAKLGAITFTGCNFYECDFSKAELPYAIFKDCSLWNCRFTSADLSNVQFHNCGVGYMYIADAKTEGLNIETVTVPGTQDTIRIYIGAANAWYVFPRDQAFDLLDVLRMFRESKRLSVAEKNAYFQFLIETLDQGKAKDLIDQAYYDKAMADLRMPVDPIMPTPAPKSQQSGGGTIGGWDAPRELTAEDF
jgi:hypothetical protein